MKKKLLTTALIGVMVIGMCSLSSCGKTSDGGGTPGGGDREGLKVVDAEWYGIDVYQLDSSSNLQQLVSESRGTPTKTKSLTAHVPTGRSARTVSPSPLTFPMGCIIPQANRLSRRM